ncbi:MAG: hypothetical protein K2O70_06915 [Desulfovibrionaceae bacterium]|nr:hypothetical protein [Desulfovibrionaceae bacterium]
MSGISAADVAALLRAGVPRTAGQICTLLKPEYGREQHLQALKAVGIVRGAAETPDADGALSLSYVISAYGRERVRKFL